MQGRLAVVNVGSGSILVELPTELVDELGLPDTSLGALKDVLVVFCFPTEELTLCRGSVV